MLYFLALLTQALSKHCQVLIAGGTLAALGAAITSSDAHSVCLIQPTQRLGGQFGDQGVWHIDFNWLYQKGYPDHQVAYNQKNLHSFMKQVQRDCKQGNCWVSRTCFLYSCIEPKIKRLIDPFVNSNRLTIYYNSVIINATRIGSSLKDVTILTHGQLIKDCRSVDQVIKDWYSRQNSVYYTKVIQRITLDYAIQASQWGDLFLLGKTTFRQGTQKSDVCGQSFVFGIHSVYDDFHRSKQNQKAADQDFSLGRFSSDQLWTYRRLKGNSSTPHRGQVSLLNWNGPGNDFKKGYLFLPRQNISLFNFSAGLNLTNLKLAQTRALNFHQWFKSVSGLPLLTTNQFFGTCNGLSRLPYVRDGRRAVGYKDFSLQAEQVTGEYIQGGNLTCQVFEDRVALGFYNMDIHPIENCSYDDFPSQKPLPFFIPFRALTSNSFSNVLFVGRAMAQSFSTSSATRTHVTEFHSGVAGMKAALLMLQSGISSWQLSQSRDSIKMLQKEIREVMPLQWTIDGRSVPDMGISERDKQ